MRRALLSSIALLGFLSACSDSGDGTTSSTTSAGGEGTGGETITATGTGASGGLGGEGGMGTGGSTGSVCPECPACTEIEDATVSSLPLEGYVLEVEVVGSRMYAVEQLTDGTLAEVTIYDVAADGTLTKRGTIATPGNADDLAVVDDTVFIADGDGGLQIADASNPDDPVVIGSLVFGAAYGVDIEGDYAFVTGGGNGLRIIDVSDPTMPGLVSVWGGAPGPFHAISVDDGVAYISVYTGSGNLYAIDVSTPTSPALLSTFPDSPSALSILAKDGVLHAATGYDVEIYDISNPAVPTHLSTFDPTGSGPHYAWREGDTMIVANSGRGVDWVDMTDPANPVLEATYRNYGPYYTAAPVAGFVVASAIYDQMRVLDPAQAKASSWPSASASFSDDISYALATDGHRAFIARGYEGLVVVDLETSTPEILSSTEIPNGNGVDVAFGNGKAYVAAGIGGLVIFDVSNPSAPSVLSQLELDGAAIEVVADDAFAYVALNPATGDGGIDVVSISNPSAPAVVAHIDRAFLPDEMVLSGGYLYLEEGGLVIYDVENPMAPVVAGEAEIPFEFSQDLAVEGDTVVVLSRRAVNEVGRLHVFDVTDKTAPMELGFVDISSDGASVALAGRYAFVGETVGLWVAPAVRVVDLADPTAPFVVHSIDAESVPSDLAVIGPDLVGLLDAGAGEDRLVLHHLCEP
ncbi:MAG: hypothetical protein HOW73_42210 [Polyangiaceae bacterium]|nr:hypothetical protein [Polyangiaceae bacterium]